MKLWLILPYAACYGALLLAELGFIYLRLKEKRK